MGRTLQIVLIAVEALITLTILIPVFLRLLLSIHLTNYKIGRNRKKMVKKMMEEGLPEHVSVKIAEYLFPKLELSPSRLISLASRSRDRRRREENASWRAE